MIGGGADGAFISIVESIFSGIGEASPFALIALGAILIGLAAYAPMIPDLKAALAAMGAGLALIGTSKLLDSNSTCTAGVGLVVGGMIVFLRIAGKFGTPVGNTSPRNIAWIIGAPIALLTKLVVCPE